MELLSDNNIVKIGLDFDPNGSVYKKGDIIIRTINPNYEKVCRELLKKDIIRKLINKGLLIQTEPYKGEIQGYNMVLQHPLIPFVSYPFEWTPSMFKDAAILMLEINIYLMENGLCTQDAHMYNILFDGSRPVFVDFTSIIEMPKNSAWPAISEFHNLILNTLLLMEKGHFKIARLLNVDPLNYPEGNFANDIYKAPGQYNSRIVREINYFYENMVIRNINFFSRYINYIKKSFFKTQYADIKGLQNELEKIISSNVIPKLSEWSDYYSRNKEIQLYDGSLEKIKEYSLLTNKHTTIERIIKEIKPCKVLDIGCNRGLFSQFAALNGAKVVGIDLDEFAIDQMYLDSKRLNSYVLPLYVNVVAPVEGVFLKEYPLQKVTERLKSDCVLALALVHHLVYRKPYMKIDLIVKILSSYSTKHLIVEFVPKEDKDVAGWYNESHDWYNENNFTLELGKYFNKIEAYESFPFPRRIFFCEK